MSRIKSKDTKPEMAIRRALHTRGYRYRLHVENMPGRPDLVFPKWRAVIQVHGCFWHGHECLGRKPKSNQHYWGPKIQKNRKRDAETVEALRALGWRVLIVWECCIVGKGRWQFEELIDRIEDWIKCGPDYCEIEGR